MDRRTSIISLLYLLTIISLMASCSSINLSARKGKDYFLNNNNINLLEGKYSNQSKDTFKRTTFINNFLDDTLFNLATLTVQLKPIDNKKITINVYDRDNSIASFELTGRYKRGYFQVKNIYVTGIPLLFWQLRNSAQYIGLTQDNNLIILDNGSPGTAFIFVIPIWGADSGEVTFIYTRQL